MHTSISRRRFLGLAASGTGAAWLAACGNRTAKRATGTPAGATRGGTLKLAAPADFYDFDMSYDAKTEPNPEGTALVYNNLVGFKYGAGLDYSALTVGPELAERWEVPADASSYTFTLRKGVTFQQLPPVNGRALTAEDVKWSLEYWARSGQFAGKNLAPGLFAYMLEGLDRVETPDASTVRVSFKQPFAPFLNYAATCNLPIVPHEIDDQSGSLKDVAIGTGPFQLDSAASQKGSRWVFTRNPTYWESGKPAVDAVHFLVVQDDASTVAAFLTRQLDILASPGYMLSEKLAQQVEKSGYAATMSTPPNPSPATLYIGVRHPPFSDERLRQALSLAIDRDEFIKVFTSGKGQWAMAGAFPDTWSQSEIKQILHFDPQRARALVAEAGHPNGVDATYLIRGKVSDEERSWAELLQAQLKAVGINVKINITPDKASGTKLFYNGDFDLILLPAVLSGDVDSYLYGRYYSTSATNYGKVNDPHLDQLIQAQRREPDAAHRRDLVREATRYLNETAQGLAIYSGSSHLAWQPYVKNYVPRWQMYGTGAKEVWLAK